MNTNPYPPIPAGFHRWEPRPRGWKSDGDVKYAFLNHRLPDPKWQEMPGTMKTFGDMECDYLEAVRDEPGPPAERPTPRTDAFFWYQREQRDALKFARILERQLAEAREQRDRLAGLLEKSLRYIHGCNHKANCIAALASVKTPE